jgi:hypothetical protein
MPTFEVGGMYFHVVPEKEAASSKKHKGHGHMVLEFWQSEGWLPDGQWNPKGRWIPMPMGIGFLLADFFCNEEDVMYGRESGNLGGDKYMRYCWDAYYKGWEHADHNLQLDKEGKAARVSRPWRSRRDAWEMQPDAAHGLARDWSAKARPHTAGPPPELSADQEDGTT